ncbi:MAG: acyloxyacyl hydrolase [Geminicoccaceae bacterium]
MRRSLVPWSLACLLLAHRAPLARAEEAPVTKFATLGPIVVHGSEKDALQLGVGYFDAFDDFSAPGANVEYRFGRKLLFIGPALGLLANTDGGVFGYFGIYADLSIANIYVTPQLAMGAYHTGDSRDLGGVFQFRESIDVSYRLANGNRFGIRVAHISNADIHEENPGEEELYVTYSIALGPLF